MSLEELVSRQRELGFSDTHLVEIHAYGFNIAHTDTERAERNSGVRLTECPMHEWLSSLDGPPFEQGIYVLIADGKFVRLEH